MKNLEFKSTNNNERSNEENRTVLTNTKQNQIERQITTVSLDSNVQWDQLFGIGNFRLEMETPQMICFGSVFNLMHYTHKTAHYRWLCYEWKLIVKGRDRANTWKQIYAKMSKNVAYRLNKWNCFFFRFLRKCRKRGNYITSIAIMDTK